MTGALPVIRKPKDATWIGPWEEGRRLFDGQSWTVEHTTHNGRSCPITVAVIGKQYDDGRVQRRIAVDVPGDPITTAEARQVIEALTQAVAMSDTGATDRAPYEIAQGPKCFQLPQAQ
jgi:GTPase